MAYEPETPINSVFVEYGAVFDTWEDLALARWLAQTLGQLEGRVWRLSHPLVTAYRLGAQVANRRQLWFQRLATPPAAYAASPCCRAPLLPFLTRDVRAEGLVCHHCNEILLPFDELPETLRPGFEAWAREYEPIHGVAHWDDRQRRRCGNYDDAYENAAQQAIRLLRVCGYELAPKLLEHYAAVIWEDQDECLDVRPEEVLKAG
jgi:hypothetical protein